MHAPAKFLAGAILAAGLAFGLSAGTAVPAAAQGIRVEVGHHHHHYDRRWRHRHREWRRHCYTVQRWVWHHHHRVPRNVRVCR